ncbi:MAG: molybdopterin-dependent oxidoreductase [Firmicutes bacterium]|nr:molybdopterin-dependent oxidoreductase [Bacillota bacterium]
MSNCAIVGKSVRRLDALEKVTGKGVFTTDIYLPGMLYAKVLRSPIPHGRIVSIDTAKAEQLPGVKAVVCYKNSSRLKFNTSATMTFTVPPLKPVLDQYIFDSVVRYVGDEVAAVAAVSEKVAAQALKLIDVQYEQLPSVYDPLEAMKPEAPVIHEDCPDGKNIPGEKVHLALGDVEQGFSESELVVEETYKVPVQKQTQMETQAAVAQVSADGKVTVWSTTQTPHPTRQILSHIFGIPHSKIRVLNPPYIGGGFGVRIGLSAKAEPIAVELALKTKKPVKMVYDRKEDFIASDTRHSGYVTIKLGVKKDGTFHALQMKGVLNTGAYCSFGTETPGVLGAMGLSVYRMPHLCYDGHSVYTNTTPAGAMRGFGNPQAIFALDSTVDIVAEKLGIDPKELRLKNIIKPGDKWCLPYPCQSSGLEKCIQKGAERIGWERRGRLNNGEKLKRGIGMGVGTHVSNAWPFCGDYSNAYVTVQQDGSIHLAVGVPDMGTGTKTTLGQFAAEIMGVDLEQVYVIISDTESTPFDIGSHASRTCYASGTAVVAAAKDAKKQVFEYAADLLGADVKDLDIVDGVIYAMDREKELQDCAGSGLCQIGRDGKPKKITLEETAYRAHLANKQFIGVGRIIPENAPPWHAHFAEVEVDVETGQVRVVKIVAVHDVGKAINPVIVEGQLHGGLAQGIGYAVSEEICYDRAGKQLQNGFHKYMQPTAEDIPEMEAHIVEAAEPTGPYGAKGVGETSLVPTAAAIANAVYDALGIRFKEIPLKEERVFQALQEQR